MTNITGFEDLADQIEELADNFDSMAERHGVETARQAIADGISDAMEERVVPEAKRMAPEGDWEDHHHKNDRERERASPGHLADSIDHEQVGWVGDTYRHKYGSTSDYEYVKVQEFGTHKTNYTITPNGDYPLSFMDNGEPVVVEYVVHPGVEGSHFMENALQNNTNEINGYVGNAIQRLLDENT
jgi:HK97 gp10 family phage protein